MNKQKQTILFTLIAALVLSGPVLTLTKKSSATSCNAADTACLEAEAKEREAQANADAATAAANSLEAEVAALNEQISAIEAAIAESQARVDQLNKEIAEKEIELSEKQTTLANLLIDLHFEANTDAVTILAGSKSLSDYAEKQARTETIKNQISIATTAVKNAKELLETDKAKVEIIIKAQQANQAELARMRTEQETMIAQYQDTAEQYAADAEAARREKQAAIAEYQRTHTEIYGGATYTGYNTYPWQGRCPREQDEFRTVINGHIVGGLACECVSYVGWKAFEHYRVYLSWGNAYSWDDRGRMQYVVDHNPAANTIGQTDSGTYGHVFWVESINSDGSINITEYNNWWSTGQISGSYHVGDFGSRRISASAARSYNYIHLEQHL